ncbi:hypothetical protein Q7P37_000707 [Cladosporium fusiforme]
MSSNTFSTSSFSYSTSSSSNTTSNGQTTGYRTMEHSSTDPINGTTVRSATQNIGEPAVEQTRHYDSQGRELLEGAGSAGGADASRRIEDVSDDAQAARDAQYEERMEDEYAKREGGA